MLRYGGKERGRSHIMSLMWSGQTDITPAPDYYADFVKLHATLFSFVLEFGLQGVPDTPASERPPGKLLARVRLSPQHALILSKLLAQQVRIYQNEIGPIAIPDQVYENLGLRKEE